MSDVNDSVPVLRTKIFSEHWPFDEAIRETASHCLPAVSSRTLRANIRIVYLTRFVKALSEKHFGCPFSDVGHSSGL